MGGSDRGFLGIAALLFAGSAAVTVAWCDAMSAMGGMPMAGGWTLSMAWMRMCDQSWLAAAASFLGMWVVMMVAMMLPPLVPMLRRYRRAVGGPRLGRLTALAGAGYFSVWVLIGIVIYPLGVTLAAAQMQVPTLAGAVPYVVGIVVLLAGVLQFAAWKARCLAECSAAPACDRSLRATPGGAWRHGVKLGLQCSSCCANLMAILIALGVMDLHVMVMVTAAIAAERLAPAGEHVAQAVGAILIGAGLFLIAQASGLA
ncbi:DUF2182 domain-containing protein [Desertibaculum subflavum]|uniref:DUF2182 domain-containing protein n=1 Tax=Desertibaculum subflavum TaxID=2268458 RepID=UPI000E660407